MLVILEAVSGPIAGRKIEVRAGTILRIGRTAKSDYALGEDSYLSGQHFAIENDGNEARARATDSRDRAPRAWRSLSSPAGRSPRVSSPGTALSRSSRHR